MFIVTLFFFSLLQVSFSARSFGVNQKPENEIIWNGYYQGQKIVEEIVQIARTRTFGTKDSLNVFFENEILPSVIWQQNMDDIIFHKSDLQFIDPEAVISSNQAITINGNSYAGHGFISNTYPIWTWDPVRSFFNK